MTRIILSILLALFLNQATATRLPKPDKTNGGPAQFGIVTLPVASLREQPAHTAELGTQASVGTPLETLEEKEEWCRVALPDGYRAWIHRSAFINADAQFIATWTASPRIVVSALEPATIVADTLLSGPRNIVSDATLNCIFQGSPAPGAKYVGVTFPDGRHGFLPASAVCDYDQWLATPPSADRIIDAACSLLGSAYLWGGSTSKAVDCSGLTQMAYLHAGILLPRNASSQAKTGQEIDHTNPDNLHTADLLFFGEGDSPKITHVGLYIGDGRFIHASGRVFIASFNPDDPLFIPRRVLRAVRILDTPWATGLHLTNNALHHFRTNP